jgi:hypothetical protein
MSGWESDLPQRMHEYWALFSPKHPQLDSLLIVLQDHPSKGTPRSCYEATTPLGRTLRFEFHLLCLWQIEAAELEALSSVVLLPLLPFTRGAGLEDIYKAFERIDAMEEDRQKREIRAGMVGTARLKFGDIDWLSHIGGKAALMGTDLYEEKALRRSAVHCLRPCSRLASELGSCPSLPIWDLLTAIRSSISRRNSQRFVMIGPSSKSSARSSPAIESPKGENAKERRSQTQAPLFVFAAQRLKIQRLTPALRLRL